MRVLVADDHALFRDGLVSLLERAPIRALGVISYGVYIFHMPCLKVAIATVKKVSPSDEGNQLVIGLVGFALTVGVAAVTYLIVERPIARWAKKRTAQR